MITIPQLSAATAQKAAEAESLSSEPLPVGIYICVLKEEVTSENGKKGVYWKWTFEVAEGEHKGRKLWTNTSLSESALWKLKEVFDAFGVPTTTDTDTLIGQRVKIMVDQELIGAGPREGEMGHYVKQVLPLGDATETPAAKAKAAKSKDEPVLF